MQLGPWGIPTLYVSVGDCSCHNSQLYPEAVLAALVQRLLVVAAAVRYWGLLRTGELSQVV